MSISTRIRREHGLSMIELLMFIVIIGIALAAVLQTMNWTSQRSGEPLKDRQALLIAEALMEEVTMARFTYCDPTDVNAETATKAEMAATDGCASIVENVGQTGAEPVGDRPFDNVNDYVSAFDTAQASFNDASGALVDAHGVRFPAGYAATVLISPTDTLGGITTSATPAGMEVLRITIVVNYGPQSVQLDGYRTRYAPNAI